MTSTEGDINRIISEIHTHIADGVGGGTYSGVHCWVSNAAMTALQNDPTLSKAFDRYRDSELYRQNLVYDSLFYRNVMFESVSR